MVLLIYKTGVLKNGDEVVKVTMDVGDGNDGFRRLRRGLGSLCPRQPRGQQNQKNGKTSAVRRNTDRRADHFTASYS